MHINAITFSSRRHTQPSLNSQFGFTVRRNPFLHERNIIPTFCSRRCKSVNSVVKHKQGFALRAHANAKAVSHQHLLPICCRRLVSWPLLFPVLPLVLVWGFCLPICFGLAFALAAEARTLCTSPAPPPPPFISLSLTATCLPLQRLR